MNSKNKKIIKERMFTMNLKNKKIFSRIAAGVMTVAMAITLLPGTMKTVNAAGTAENPLESVQFIVTLHKRANVYTPNTKFQFDVTGLSATDAKGLNEGNDSTPEFKNAPAGGVTAETITLTPGDNAGELNSTSIKRPLKFTFKADEFKDIGTYRYKVKQQDLKYEGITYDTGDKYLDVIVAREGDNVYIENAFLISNGEKIEEVVNTYGVKPDPDHPGTLVPDGTVNDLVISKKVTGNFGERDKEFSFDITITGADNESYYLVRLPEKAGETEEKIGELKSGVEKKITLHHGQSVKIYGLTEGDKYKIQEKAETGYTTKFETKVGETVIGDGAVASNVAEGNIDKGTSLQTQTVAFTNNRTGSATGFVSSYGPYALMVVLAGAVAFVLFRKRRAEY